MNLVDVHTHLFDAQFEKDCAAVVARAEKAGVKRSITNGLDTETNRACISLAQKYSSVYASVGIYPVNILWDHTKNARFPLALPRFDVDAEVAWILREGKKEKNKIVAIGEVGLDNFTIKGFLDQQKPLFEQMIAAAEKLKKPIIIHSRSAEKECIDMLQSSSIKPVNIVMHCFGGAIKLAMKAADAGFNFSIPTNVVFSSQFQELTKRININQLFTETDAPYLGPVKGERNEPANIVHSIKKIAEIKGFDVTETANAIFMNYQRVFG